SRADPVPLPAHGPITGQRRQGPIMCNFQGIFQFFSDVCGSERPCRRKRNEKRARRSAHLRAPCRNIQVAGRRYLYYPPSSASTLCGVELARASTLVPALTRIWLRVRRDVSCAKSVSRIADSLAVRFSIV